MCLVNHDKGLDFVIGNRELSEGFKQCYFVFNVAMIKGWIERGRR